MDSMERVVYSVRIDRAVVVPVWALSPLLRRNTIGEWQRRGGRKLSFSFVYYQPGLGVQYLGMDGKCLFCEALSLSELMKPIKRGP
jgi:hypothetical protein